MTYKDYEVLTTQGFFKCNNFAFYRGESEIDIKGIKGVYDEEEGKGFVTKTVSSFNSDKPFVYGIGEYVENKRGTEVNVKRSEGVLEINILERAFVTDFAEATFEYRDILKEFKNTRLLSFFLSKSIDTYFTTGMLNKDSLFNFLRTLYDGRIISFLSREEKKVTSISENTITSQTCVTLDECISKIPENSEHYVMVYFNLEDLKVKDILKTL